MSADGEISVSVTAEGTDEAAGELGGGDGMGGGGPDAPDGDGGGGKGGTFGKLLSRIAGLLVFLGPIFDVLGAISGIITAFVAPMAVMLMRLLMPLIRLMLAILPAWLAVTSAVNDAIEKLGEPLALTLMTIKLIKTGIDMAVQFLSDMKDRLGVVGDGIDITAQILRELPQRIGNLLPSLGGGDGGLVDRGRDFLGLGGDDGGGDGGTSIMFSGGLGTFVDNITRDGSVDFP